MIYPPKTKTHFWFLTCHHKINFLRSSSNLSFCHYFIPALLNDRYLIGASKAEAPITLLFCLSEGQVEVLNPFSDQLSVSPLFSLPPLCLSSAFGALRDTICLHNKSQ